MRISYQSAQGHTVLDRLTDEEVETKFNELTKQGYRGFASTDLEQPVGPLKTIQEAREAQADEVYMIAPLVGG
jgi:hypothetical protein